MYSEWELAALANWQLCPEQKLRIRKLEWTHDGENQSCEIGGPIPARFNDKQLTVLAILDCGKCYKIFFGNMRDPSIMLADINGKPTYFD